MKLLLYCTKAKPYLKRYWFNGDEGSGFNYENSYCQNEEKECEENLNGKIVAECDFEVEEIENNVCGFGDYKLPYFETETLTGKEIEDKSCLSYEQLKGYLQNNGNGFYGYSGYAIHIKNLHIFDKPRWLYNVYYKSVYSWGITYEIGYHEIHKAPQNMMYVYDKEGKEKNILISIKPEWLCKILNGEKTIEVRKKVLKEML